MSKRFGKVLLALMMMLALALGDLAPGLAWAGVPGQGSRMEASASLQAKSRKKKKNTPTPAPAESQSPAPAEPDSDGAKPTPTPVPEGPITDPQSIADYLFSHEMQLPENFITKKEAQRLGWDSSYNYVSDVAPGKSIGGDYFGNYEGKLPTGKGISYHEADCNYTKGRRKAARVVYSTEGRVWYTEDHYETFTELFPTGAD